MSTTAQIEQTWVAQSSAGVVGSIHRSSRGFSVRLRAAGVERGPYDSLEVAKRSLTAALGPGAVRPTFTEH